MHLLEPGPPRLTLPRNPGVHRRGRAEEREQGAQVGASQLHSAAGAHHHGHPRRDLQPDHQADQQLREQVRFTRILAPAAHSLSRREHLVRAWELLLYCVCTFLPSENFVPYLAVYINHHMSRSDDVRAYFVPSFARPSIFFFLMCVCVVSRLLLLLLWLIKGAAGRAGGDVRDGAA